MELIMADTVGAFIRDSVDDHGDVYIWTLTFLYDYDYNKPDMAKKVIKFYYGYILLYLSHSQSHMNVGPTAHTACHMLNTAHSAH